MEIQSLKDIDKLFESQKEKIKKERKAGTKVVGYICCQVPLELIHAHGIMAVRLGTAAESYMATGKEYIHQYTCPYIKCVVGEMLTKGTFSHDNVDVISGSVICLTVHRALEVLKAYTKKPTYYLAIPHLPPNRGEERFFVSEMEWFSARLSEISGRRLDPQRLRESVALYNSIRATLKELYRLQAMDGSAIRWIGVFKLIQSGFLLGPEEYLKLLEDVLSEVKQVSETEGPSTHRKFRIMLSGSPVMPMDNILIDTIEGTGGRIVADTLCTGLRTFDDLLVEDATLKGLAHTYLYSSPCASCQDLDIKSDRRLNKMLKLISEIPVEGMVYYCLRFCDPYSFKDDEIKEVLWKEAGLPVLPIHWEYGGSYGPLRTRVEGFLESLQERMAKR
jgi:benzoyl-CoA reductase/2-hydroxyglutaryl-CoA dehydratase subunit BcrC/BadD/HgdB